MVFGDRKEAGRLLGEFLKDKIYNDDCIVFGIPRGGVVVAKEVAKVLDLPLGIIIVRKLGVPSQTELAFGAVDLDGEVYIDKRTVEYFRIDRESIDKVKNKELQKIKQMQEKFLSREVINFEGKNVIVVDDGIATGYTIIAGVKYLIRHGAKKVIVAVPVCPVESIQKLKRFAHEVYCYLQVKEGPYAVGMFYRDFKQVEDYEVEEILRG